MLGLAPGVRGGKPTHAAADDEDVELVGARLAVLENGVNGAAFGVLSGVGCHEGTGVRYRGGHVERLLGERRGIGLNLHIVTPLCSSISSPPAMTNRLT